MLYKSGFFQQNPHYSENQSFTFGKHFMMHWKILIEVQMVKGEFFRLLPQNLPTKNSNQN